MTIYVEIKNNKVNASTSNIKIAETVFEKFITTEFEDYTPTNIKYIFDGKSIILNPNYENKLEKQRKEQRKIEILNELEEIDFKSIRMLRTGETDKLEKLEQQANKLRKELANL